MCTVCNLVLGQVVQKATSRREKNQSQRASTAEQPRARSGCATEVCKIPVWGVSGAVSKIWNQAVNEQVCCCVGGNTTQPTHVHCHSRGAQTCTICQLVLHVLTAAFRFQPPHLS